jgi:protein SCO1/2
MAIPRPRAGTGPAKSRTRRLLLVLGAVIAGAVIALGIERLQIVAPPQVGGAFVLTDHDGRRVRDTDFRGRAMAVFFGFTHCPDICPTALARMSEVLDALGPDADAVQALFVSVDPRRDTPALLKDYVTHVSPRILGLTGSEAEIAAVARAYRVYYRINGDPETNPNYLVDHSGFVYVMDRSGRFVGTFNPDAPVDGATRLMRRAL